jgi:Xaa-Pro aminopeptidase
MKIHLKRLEKLRSLLPKAKCDAFLINHPANLNYYTGYSGDSAYLLVTAEKSCFFTDGRYTTQAAAEIPTAIDLIRIAAFKDLGRYVKEERTVKNLGADENQICAGNWFKLQQEITPCELKAAAAVLSEPRLHKDKDELKLLRRAVEIAESALQNSLSLLQPGTRESDLAAEIEYQIRLGGGERAAFPLIVASGPRSALPHGVASDRLINHGDIVTIDFGACYKGYHSDQTCTFFLQEPEADVRQAYEIIYQAQEIGFAALKEKITGLELDRIVREYIADAGMGREFSHGTGHGIGLEIHEAPSISQHSQAGELEPGMVFTIEPGCYFPNRWGIRIEDTIHLSVDGTEKLTTIDKRLENMVIN